MMGVEEDEVETEERWNNTAALHSLDNDSAHVSVFLPFSVP